MPKASRASSDVTDLIDELIGLRYPDLRHATIGALMVNAGLRDRGRYVPAKIKINSASDRLEGLPDATIRLDLEDWIAMGLQIRDCHRLRAAVIEPMLYSLRILMCQHGKPKEDAAGRPRLELREPDWVFAGFKEMAERHGQFSQEVIQAKRLHEQAGHLLFGPDEPTSDLVREAFAAATA